MFFSRRPAIEGLHNDAVVGINRAHPLAGGLAFAIVVNHHGRDLIDLVTGAKALLGTGHVNDIDHAGRRIAFNGAVASRLTFPDAVNIIVTETGDGLGDFATALMANPADSASGSVMIGQGRPTAGPDWNQWAFLANGNPGFGDSNGELSFSTIAQTSTGVGTTAAGAIDGTTHRYAGARRGTSHELYVDSPGLVAAASGTVRVIGVESTSRIILSGFPDGNGFEYGANIRCAFGWNRAPSADQIAEWLANPYAMLQGPASWVFYDAGQLVGVEFGAAVDWSAGVRGGDAVPVDLAAVTRRTDAAPVDNLSTQARAEAAPVELRATARGDGAAPTEIRATLRGDGGAPVEWSGAVQLAVEAAAPVEILAALVSQTVAPVELRTSVLSSPAAMVEFLALVASGQSGPVEILSARAGDGAAPVEWAGAVLVGASDTAPVEIRSTVRGEMAAPVDWRSVVVVAEALPVEFRGGVAVDARAIVDWLASVGVAASVPAAFRSLVVIDGAMPAEWTGQAQFVVGNLNVFTAAPRGTRWVAAARPVVWTAAGRAVIWRARKR